MRTIITCSLIALGLCAVTPVMAQGISIGPGGVGVDSGLRRHRGDNEDRGYEGRGDEGRGERYDRDRDDREGRSASERDGHRRHSDDN